MSFQHISPRINQPPAGSPRFDYERGHVKPEEGPRFVGTIVRVGNGKKGRFGFIKPDSGDSKEIYFHFEKVDSERKKQFVKGAKVSYSIDSRPRRSCAVKVRIHQGFQK